MAATSQIAQTTLRAVLGQHVLDELLSEREKINAILQGIIDEATGPWGIKVSIVEVKDVEIPTGMQKAMARQAEAERERRAKIINSEGEFQAAERLKDAALVLEEHPIALQLRYLQTLIEISGTPSTTIVFPAPIDIIKPFLERADKRAHSPSSGGSSFSVSTRGSKSWCTPSRSTQDRAHPERERALDVVRDRVADHHRLGRLDSEQVEDGAEDRRVRLRAAVVERADAGVDVEPVVARELAHVARRVRDEPDAEAGGAERRERVRHVVVELEVLVLLPAARDLHGAVVGRVGVAAHAADDALGEAEPDLVVVLELGMAAEIDERGVASGLVASGLEGEPVALAGADVPLRPELRSRPRQREVDVEEDRRGASLATLWPVLGVWRSLVARSVRVGEVPSSNLGTPISLSLSPAGAHAGREHARPGESPSPIAAGVGARRQCGRKYRCGARCSG